MQMTSFSGFSFDIVCLTLLFLTASADHSSCSNEYKERFCSLSPKNRRLEGIRLEINKEAIQRCQQMESEIKKCYKYLSSLPIFASDIKLMALLTAHRDFKLRSFYGFEYIMNPLSFHNALDQIFYRERSALISMEFSMEMLMESARVIRNDYESFLQLDSQDMPTQWKGAIHDDTSVFEIQLKRTTSAENELNEAHTTFIELYNALDEKDFTSIPVGVRSKVQRLMRIHKNGYRDLLLIIQSVQIWMANATKVLSSIARECELSDVRSYREKECTVRHAVASRILEAVENYAENFDQLCDEYLKSYYLTSPLSLIRYINEDQLDDLQTEIEAKYSTVSKQLQNKYDKLLRQQELRNAKKLGDLICHRQLMKEKNIEYICNQQLFKRLAKQ